MDHTNDPERQDSIITEVRPQKGGFDIQQDNGWGLWLSDEYGLTPKAGDTVTIFGKGIGFAFRGVLINGALAFYRTEDEQKQWALEQQYGIDAAEWLARWDRGDGIWTLEMGGLSAGYDQSINIMAAEMVRALLDLKPELVTGEAITAELKAAIDTAIGSAPSVLGLSGAQYHGALSVALGIYHLGPIQFVSQAPSDRRVQASKRWPSLTPNLDRSAGQLLAALRLLVAAAECEEQPTPGELEDAKAAIEAATAT